MSIWSYSHFSER